MNFPCLIYRTSEMQGGGGGGGGGGVGLGGGGQELLKGEQMPCVSLKYSLERSNFVGHKNIV